MGSRWCLPWPCAGYIFSVARHIVPIFLLTQPRIVAAPAGADLVLARAAVIAGRDDGQGALDGDQHDVANRAGRASLAEEGEHALEVRPVSDDLRPALEAVALARDGVHDVDLAGGVRAQIAGGARRADVGEDQVVVVPDGERALGREVGRAVRADRGDVA